MKISKANSALLAELLMCPSTGVLSATPEVLNNIEFEAFFKEQTQNRNADLVVLQYNELTHDNPDDILCEIIGYGVFSKKHKLNYVTFDGEVAPTYKPKQLKGSNKLYRNALGKCLLKGTFKRMPFIRFNPVKSVTTQSITANEDNILALTADNNRYLKSGENYYSMDRGFITINKT